jgi:hypothetical protein
MFHKLRLFIVYTLFETICQPENLVKKIGPVGPILISNNFLAEAYVSNTNAS